MRATHGFILLPDRSTTIELARIGNAVVGDELRLSPEYSPPFLAIGRFEGLPNEKHRQALEALQAGIHREIDTLFSGIAIDETVEDGLQKVFLRLEERPWLAKLRNTAKASVGSELETDDAQVQVAIAREAVEPSKTTLDGGRVRFHSLALAQLGNAGELRSITAQMALPVSWDW